MTITETSVIPQPPTKSRRFCLGNAVEPEQRQSAFFDRSRLPTFSCLLQPHVFSNAQAPETTCLELDLVRIPIQDIRQQVCSLLRPFSR